MSTDYDDDEIPDGEELIPVPWNEIPQFYRDIKADAALSGRRVSLPADAPAALRAAAMRTNTLIEDV